VCQLARNGKAEKHSTELKRVPDFMNALTDAGTEQTVEVLTFNAAAVRRILPKKSEAKGCPPLNGTAYKLFTFYFGSTVSTQDRT
jgi:hypothetical protein